MFIVSQSYDKSDPNLPTNFKVSGLPSGDVTVPATVAADQSVTLHLDISDLVPGTYSVTADASNVAGSSAMSDPLSVVISPPVGIPSVPVLSTSAS